MDWGTGFVAARNPGKVSYNSSFRKAQKAKGGSTRVGSVGVKMRVAEGDLGDMMAELENLRTSMVDSQEFMVRSRASAHRIFAGLQAPTVSFCDPSFQIVTEFWDLKLHWRIPRSGSQGRSIPACHGLLLDTGVILT